VSLHELKGKRVLFLSVTLFGHSLEHRYITMHSLSLLSGSTLLALLVSPGYANIVTLTTSITLTTCYTPPPPPCSTVIGVGSSAWSSLLSNGGSIIGSGTASPSGGGGGSGGNGGSGSSNSLSSSSYPSSVAPTYTSGWNTTTYPNSTIAPTYTSSPSSSTVLPSISTSTSSSSTTSSSTTSSSTTSSTAPACTDYWLATIDHQGLAPYAPAGYKVFRNVKDYGAKGQLFHVQ
jgi:glucan 1,3-beta-glucosidase